MLSMGCKVDRGGVKLLKLLHVNECSQNSHLGANFMARMNYLQKVVMGGTVDLGVCDLQFGV